MRFETCASDENRWLSESIGSFAESVFFCDFVDCVDGASKWITFRISKMGFRAWKWSCSMTTFRVTCSGCDRMDFGMCCRPSGWLSSGRQFNGLIVDFRWNANSCWPSTTRFDGIILWAGSDWTSNLGIPTSPIIVVIVRSVYDLWCGDAAHIAMRRTVVNIPSEAFAFNQSSIERELPARPTSQPQVECENFILRLLCDAVWI